MRNDSHIMDSHAHGETCLVGQLETWALADLLLWLHQSQRTAMVRIGVGLDAGVIFVRHGYLYRCEWGGVSGVQALMALLAVRSGVFSLIQRDVPQPSPNIFVPTEQLLLQLAVRQDERRLAASA